MPLYRCEWPNGDVSFVLADDVQDAIVKLDEWGEATPKMLRKVTQFLIDLSPQRDVLAQRAKLRALLEGVDGLADVRRLTKALA